VTPAALVALLKHVKRRPPSPKPAKEGCISVVRASRRAPSSSLGQAL
jgi:hypothetical protein